ncbi:MAG: hypothetical protein LBM98_13130 [Oscillospiraceae bacterium]|jgi:hypothetical protein|nr:hypothetical protein [Oscillospiraceae bacterium]
MLKHKRKILSLVLLIAMVLSIAPIAPLNVTAGAAYGDDTGVTYDDTYDTLRWHSSEVAVPNAMTQGDYFFWDITAYREGQQITAAYPHGSENPYTAEIPVWALFADLADAQNPQEGTYNFTLESSGREYIGMEPVTGFVPVAPTATATINFEPAPSTAVITSAGYEASTGKLFIVAPGLQLGDRYWVSIDGTGDYFSGQYRTAGSVFSNNVQNLIVAYILDDFGNPRPAEDLLGKTFNIRYYDLYNNNDTPTVRVSKPISSYTNSSNYVTIGLNEPLGSKVLWDYGQKAFRWLSDDYTGSIAIYGGPNQYFPATITMLNVYRLSDDLAQFPAPASGSDLYASNQYGAPPYSGNIPVWTLFEDLADSETPWDFDQRGYDILFRAEKRTFFENGTMTAPEIVAPTISEKPPGGKFKDEPGIHRGVTFEYSEIFGLQIQSADYNSATGQLTVQLNASAVPTQSPDNFLNGTYNVAIEGRNDQYGLPLSATAWATNGTIVLDCLDWDNENQRYVPAPAESIAGHGVSVRYFDFFPKQNDPGISVARVSRQVWGNAITLNGGTEQHTAIFPITEGGGAFIIWESNQIADALPTAPSTAGNDVIPFVHVRRSTQGQEPIGVYDLYPNDIFTPGIQSVGAPFWDMFYEYSPQTEWFTEALVPNGDYDLTFRALKVETLPNGNFYSYRELFPLERHYNVHFEKLNYPNAPIIANAVYNEANGILRLDVQWLPTGNFKVTVGDGEYAFSATAMTNELGHIDVPFLYNGVPYPAIFFAGSSVSIRGYSLQPMENSPDIVRVSDSYGSGNVTINAVFAPTLTFGANGLTVSAYGNAATGYTVARKLANDTGSVRNFPVTAYDFSNSGTISSTISAFDLATNVNGGIDVTTPATYNFSVQGGNTVALDIKPLAVPKQITINSFTYDPLTGQFRVDGDFPVGRYRVAIPNVLRGWVNNEGSWARTGDFTDPEVVDVTVKEAGRMDFAVIEAYTITNKIYDPSTLVVGKFPTLQYFKGTAGVDGQPGVIEFNAAATTSQVAITAYSTPTITYADRTLNKNLDQTLTLTGAADYYYKFDMAMFGDDTAGWNNVLYFNNSGTVTFEKSATLTKMVVATDENGDNILDEYDNITYEAAPIIEVAARETKNIADINGYNLAIGDSGNFVQFADMSDLPDTLTDENDNLMFPPDRPISDFQSLAVSVGKPEQSNNALTVTASEANGGALTYQWYVNNEKINSATSNTYSLSGLADGTHNFYCVVSAGNGSVSVSSATLRVIIVTNPTHKYYDYDYSLLQENVRPTTNPSREGYTFTDYSEKLVGNEIQHIAQYAPITATVKFVTDVTLNGSPVETVLSENSVSYNKIPTAPEVAPVAGQKFVGWRLTGADNNGLVAVTSGDPYVYTAQWEDVDTDNTYLTHNGKVLETRPQSEGAPKDPTRAGYKFDGWAQTFTGSGVFTPIYEADENSAHITSNSNNGDFAEINNIYIEAENVTLSGLTDFSGNIYIVSKNVTLSGVTVTGGFIEVAETVGDGEVKLKNVNTPKLNVKGGGKHSVVLENTHVTEEIVIDKPASAGSEPVAIRAEGDTTVTATNVQSPAVLDTKASTSTGTDSGLGAVSINPGASNVEMAGLFASVTVNASKAEVSTDESTVIDTVTVQAVNVEISGAGKLKEASVTDETKLDAGLELTKEATRTTYYTITTDVTGNGVISLSGAVGMDTEYARANGTYTFTIVPLNDNYKVSTVKVGGVDATLTKVDGYDTFTVVVSNADVTVEVTFVPIYALGVFDLETPKRAMTLVDVTTVYQIARTQVVPENQPEVWMLIADVNKSGKVTIADVELAYQVYRHKRPAFVNE